MSKFNTEERINRYGKCVKTYSDPVLYDLMLSQIELHTNMLSEAKVLDLGCGTGLSSVHLREIVRCIHYLDISEDMIQAGINARNIDDTNIIIHDLNNMPLPIRSNTIDICLSRYVIHDIRKKIELFCELNRIIKPDGILQLVDMFGENDSVAAFINKVHGWKTHNTSLQPVYVETIECYKRMLNKAGFKFLDMKTYRSRVSTEHWVNEAQITLERKQFIDNLIRIELEGIPELMNVFHVSDNDKSVTLEFPVFVMSWIKEK